MKRLVVSILLFCSLLTGCITAAPERRMSGTEDMLYGQAVAIVQALEMTFEEEARAKLTAQLKRVLLQLNEAAEI